jgi:hypothetical protein
MRRRSLHRQSSDSALGSSFCKPSPSPGLRPPRSAWRGARARGLVGCQSPRTRLLGGRGGARPFGATPLLARRPYRACALPPGLHLGIGRKRERETGTRSGLWCGERLRQRRGEGERARGLSAAPYLQSFSCPQERRGEREEARAGARAVTLGPRVRGAVRPDVLGVGPL